MNDAIRKRRSIRKFTSEEVSSEDIAKIIDAGAAAPSAKSIHPVRFILLGREEMNNIAAKITQKAPFLEGRAAIAVVADTRGYKEGLAWIDDCAAAMENMLLEATDLGLGALWYGVHAWPAKVPVIREALALPEGVEVCGIAIIGHAGESKPEHGTADPAIIHKGRWSE